MSRLLLGLGVLLSGALLALLFTGNSQTTPEDVSALFETIPVVRGDISTRIKAEGRVESSLHYRIHARSAGTVEAVFVREGEPVKEGQLLLKMESAMLESQIRENRISLNILSKHQAVSAKIALDRARIEEARARLRLKELQALVEADLAARDKLDEKRFEFELASTRVQEAQNQLQQISLEQAAKQEQFKRLMSELREREVRAPHGGILTRVYLRHAGQPVQAGTSLFDIDDVHHLIVRARVDELDALGVCPGQKAEVRWKGNSKVLGTGSVLYRAHRADRDQDHSYVEIHVGLTGEKGSLLVGNNVMVEILTQERVNTLLVPSEALQVRGGNPFVQVLRDGEVREIHVRIGVSDPDRIEICKGLSEGDRVVLANRGEARP